LGHSSSGLAGATDGKDREESACNAAAVAVFMAQDMKLAVGQLEADLPKQAGL
jgi:hypothetical protein